MATIWKLQGGTVAAATDIATLGIEGLVRHRRSLGTDELSFCASGANIDSTALFAYGDEVVLTRTEGTGSPVTWFRGRCIQVPRTAKGLAEDLHYVIAGAWWYFENLVFQQIWPLDPAANSHLTSPATYRRAIVIAGLASSTGLRQNTKAFLQDVLDWLIGSGTSAVTQYTAGDLPAGFDVPFMRLDAPTCAEAIKLICRWMPDAVSWFDYTTNPPTFHLVRRSTSDASNLALTALTEIDLTPRQELQLEKLIIQYVTLNDDGMVVLHEDKDPAGSGTTGREWGGAVITINNNYLPMPTGLAATYRAGLSTLQYSGRLVSEEAECNGTIAPGQVINVTGGLTAWATMNAHVVETVEEIDAGRTTITVGPPNHIRIDDLVEVLRIARNQSDQFGGTGQVLKTGKQDKAQRIFADLTSEFDVPTGTEVATALEAAFSGRPAPQVGDIVGLSFKGQPTFMCHIHTLSAKLEPSGLWIVGIGSETLYAHVYQLRPLFQCLRQTLTMAGISPTNSEITTAIQTAYTGKPTPRTMDEIELTISGTPKLRAIVIQNVSLVASGIWVVSFVVSGVTYYARVYQIGMF